MKFYGMMHSTMKQMAMWNGYAQIIFVYSTEVLKFPL